MRNKICIFPSFRVKSVTITSFSPHIDIEVYLPISSKSSRYETRLLEKSIFICLITTGQITSKKIN